MSFEKGLIAAIEAGEIWNSQRNPPKLYIEGTRIHHYHVGIALFVVGALLRSPTLAGIGAGLFLHDINDIQW